MVHIFKDGEHIQLFVKHCTRLDFGTSYFLGQHTITMQHFFFISDTLVSSRTTILNM